jgi:hypothetical protein
MRSIVTSDIHVVIAKKDAAIEYWAAATVRDKAVAAVEKELLPDRDANETATNSAARHKAENAT